MGMNQHEKPAPPARRWGEALDPHAHQGPYRPPAALLDILARAAGANSYETATTAVRNRAASAATERCSSKAVSGFSPRSSISATSS
mgnify:CR=1 FL=1